MEKVVGILGGMGPEATSDIFKKMISKTEANSDQEHIRIIVENNVKIPDRTSHILNNGVNPIKHLIKSAIRLELMGADIIVMPCNTAHYFYDEIVKYIDVQFLNMIEEVGKFIYESHGSNINVGLLATKGTYAGEVYETYCQPYGLNITTPSPDIQELLLNLIYDVKKGKKNIDLNCIRAVLKEFSNQGIYTLILGCTELPLVFNNLDLEEAKNFTFVDATDVLAQRAVELARGEVHSTTACS